MNLLAEHIDYLLTGHDCVIIPGFGALINRHISAVYDEDNGEISAPFREITFNREIAADDGLIASSVARRQGVAYSTAASIVANEVEAMLSQISVGGRFSLGAVGEFRSNGSDGIEFIPAAYECRLKSVSTGVSKPDESADSADSVKITPLRPYSPITAFVSRVASVVALALILGFAIYNPTRVGEGVMRASLMPELGRLLPDNGVQDMEIDDVIPEETPDEVAETVDAEIIDTVAEPAPVVEPIETRAGGRYYLIVASLASRALAEQFIADENSPSFEIMETDGRYRVAGACGSSASEVRDAGLLSRYPDAWVYVAR